MMTLWTKMTSETREGTMRRIRRIEYTGEITQGTTARSERALCRALTLSLWCSDGRDRSGYRFALKIGTGVP